MFERIGSEVPRSLTGTPIRYVTLWLDDRACAFLCTDHWVLVQPTFALDGPWITTGLSARSRRVAADGRVWWY